MAQKEDNTFRLFGYVTIAHVAVGCLQEIGTDKALEKMNLLISQKSGVERDDLLDYLERVKVSN
ncbi:MAG: hypothetical protein AAFR81_21135 [Chloroflexota bacterium]